MAHGLSCSAACGIFPDQGSKPCPLPWHTVPTGKSYFFNLKNHLSVPLLSFQESRQICPQMAGDIFDRLFPVSYQYEKADMWTRVLKLFLGRQNKPKQTDLIKSWGFGCDFQTSDQEVFWKNGLCLSSLGLYSASIRSYCVSGHNISGWGLLIACA